jgi:CheY-like chemotaxis protein
MKKRISVVEDDEVLSFLYCEELKSKGYEVLTAENGKLAIQKLEEGKPDLIVLDIAMPVMDGMEALSPILEKERKILSSFTLPTRSIGKILRLEQRMPM